MKTAIATSLAVLTLATFAEDASAKDWLENVEIQTLLDVDPIKVRSNGSKYTSPTKSTHQFNMKLYAKAKKGKRIAYAKFGLPNIKVGHKDTFSKKVFKGAIIGNGKKRAWSFDGKFNYALRDVAWFGGHDPRTMCQLKLGSELKKGRSKSEIFSKTLTTSATAQFSFIAAAAKPKVAKAGINFSKKKSYTWEKVTKNYQVKVQCLPSPNNKDKVQS